MNTPDNGERWRGGVDSVTQYHEQRIARLEEYIKEANKQQAEMANSLSAMKATLRVVIAVAVPTLAVVINLLIKG